jgi:hypothetical protein
MLCPKCGTNNDDSTNICMQCGEILTPAVQPDQPISEVRKVPNYLVQAILVTIFCCLPLGIPAIIFAAQVNGKIQAGDYSGALDASNKAKLWSWVSFGVGLAVILIYAIFMVVVGSMSKFMR